MTTLWPFVALFSTWPPFHRSSRGGIIFLGCSLLLDTEVLHLAILCLWFQHNWSLLFWVFLTALPLLLRYLHWSLLSFIFATFNAVGLLIILLSYAFIVVTIIKMHSASVHHNAFWTWASQSMVSPSSMHHPVSLWCTHLQELHAHRVASVLHSGDSHTEPLDLECEK